MPVALAVAVAASLVAWLAFAAWQGRLVSRALQSRQCPSCGEAMEALTDGPGSEAGAVHPRSYEVAACPACHTLVTSIHGARSAFAYCPSCRQLSLELEATWASEPGVDGRPPVDVSERCSICGYTGDVEIPGDESHPGRPDNVIPFPQRKAD